MLTIDWIMIGLVALSTLISLKRGFVKEALSLATWIVAFIIARLFGGQLAGFLSPWIELPSMQLVAAFALLFVGTLIVGAMINYLVGELVKMTGLSGTDRIFGMVFGFTRGMVVLLVAVGMIRLTPLTEDEWWQNSRLVPELLQLEQQSREMLFDSDTTADTTADEKT